MRSQYRYVGSNAILGLWLKGWLLQISGKCFGSIRHDWKTVSIRRGPRSVHSGDRGIAIFLVDLDELGNIVDVFHLRPIQHAQATVSRSSLMPISSSQSSSFAKHFGDTADSEDVSDRSHGQAARPGLLACHG
jgi:hypothetical protein